MNALSQLIFNPILFITENFYEAITDLSKKEKVILKGSITEPSDEYLFKFLTSEYSKIDYFTIPIESKFNFSVLSFAEKIVNKVYSCNQSNLGGETQECEENIMNENNEENLLSFCLENKENVDFEKFLIEIIDKIIILFNSVIFGSSYHPKPLGNTFYIYSAYHFIADFYKSMSKDFKTYSVEYSLFFRKYKITKENLDSLFEKAHSTTETRTKSSKKFRLIKRLLNLNLNKGLIEINGWFDEKINPKIIIHQNERTLISSLIKNYLLLDSLAGKLTDTHAEDLVKFVSIVYKKGVENNKAFLRLVPQFYEFFERFILNTNNFAIRSFSECFREIFCLNRDEYNANAEKYLCPYKSDEPFTTFINQIKLFIDVFNIKNSNLSLKKFEMNIIEENLEIIYLGIDQLIEILFKNSFDLNQPRHRILGIKNLFETNKFFLNIVLIFKITSFFFNSA